MRDELDGRLLRHFANSQWPLADARFVAGVSAQLHARAGRDALIRVLHGAVRATLTGFQVGISAPLRLRHAGLMALAAAGFTLGTILLSSL